MKKVSLRIEDAEQGRMLSKDPVKRGLNPYPYCSNDPVNYVDPTGEIANILAGGALGGLVGGAAGFIGSGISQISSGEKFNMKKAAGSAVNGAVVGAVRGALVGSGVGVIGALGANFAAGVAGDALEQSIGSGKVDMGRSVTSGLTNAVSSAIYGTNPLNSVKEAIGRGAGAGAATAAINNLSDAWRNRGNHDTKPHVLTDTGSNYLPGIRQDPKTCNIRSPFNGNIGYNGGKGYQYEVKGSSGKTGFSLGDFCKDVLVGTVMGGLSSAAFYGGGKALEKLGNSIKGGSTVSYKYNMVENPGPLADMPNNPASNFASGKYNMNTLPADTTFYRAGESGTPYGQWFTSAPANSAIQVRMDTAVKPQWINSSTGVLEGHSYVNTNYAINIPKGTTVYTGPVGYQGGAYLGGQDILQTFIHKPWNIPGVKVISSKPLH